MISLPIAARELRVASRKPATFWSRWVAVLAASMLAGGFLLLSHYSNQREVGGALFSMLSGLSFVGVVLAGLFLTSDSVSEEKREGTLGFLLLTPLGGFDVLTGKLLATSLRGAYGLLAVLPVLGLPLLMGGVSIGQFARTAGALLSTLALSLAAGLFVSTVSRQAQKAMLGTFLLMILLTAGGPAVDGLWAASLGKPYVPRLSLVSPGYLMAQAGGVTGANFWPGWLGVNLVSLTLFGLAGRLVFRTWRDREAGRPGLAPSGWVYRWKFGSPARREALRGKLLDLNPVLWLVCRERWQSLGIWVLAGLMFATLLGWSFVAEGEVMLFIWMPLVWLSVMGVYVWAATQASRFLVEARRTRAIELLLGSPLEVAQIVRGQWSGWLRMFGTPVLLLLLLQVMGNVVLGMGSRAGAVSAMGMSAVAFPSAVGVLLASVSTTITTLANLLGIFWFGMVMGLTSRNSNFAALKTLLWVMVVPWFALTFLTGMLFALSAPLFMSQMGGTSWLPIALTLAPASLVVLKDVFFVVWSRRVLLTSFRERLAAQLIPVVAAPPRLAGRPAAVPGGGGA